MNSVIFTSFVFLITCETIWSIYDENFVRYKTWPMASATFSSNPELCIHDNFKNASLIRQITVSCDLDKKKDSCSGFTAVSNSDKAIILAFRGSLTYLQEFFEAYDGIFLTKTNFVGGGGVNAYFYQAFLDIWNAGMRDDLLTAKNTYPDYELWVTGHSLGAAMASLCAGYISYLQYFSSNQIKLVTYGQPRTGDLAYANYIDNSIPYTYRVIHAHDMVPHLPAIQIEFIGDLKNYTHHKNEVWYNNNMVVGSTYVECDSNESYNCSDQLEKNFDLIWEDHDHYFNVSYDFAMNGCPNYNPGKFVVN